MRRGVTLIEMLISIAILSLLSAGLIAVFVQPLRERVHAEAEMGMLTGASDFFSALVQDLHAADSVELDPAGDALTVVRNGAAEVRYFIDAGGSLHRETEDGPDSILLGGVTSLECVEAHEGRALSVRLSVATPSLDRVIERHEAATLALGPALREAMQ